MNRYFGAIIGAVAAMVGLQWGPWGLVFAVLFAALGHVVQHWLLPHKEALWQWLKAAPRELEKD